MGGGTKKKIIQIKRSIDEEQFIIRPIPPELDSLNLFSANSIYELCLPSKNIC
jgi:hypothetical protein